MRITLFAAIVAALALAGAAFAAKGSVAPHVTGVMVSPSPFYDDEPFMTVKFKTSVAAPAGKLYFLLWESDAAVGTAQENCSVLSNADPIGYKGGTNIVVTAKLVPDALFGGHAFCPGPSIIQVVMQRAKANRHMGNPTPNAKPLVVYRFRVYRQP